MTLPHCTLQYRKYSKEELRGFLMRRLNLSGAEYSKASKRELVRQLLRLDQNATFRLLDLPPELREHCFGNAVANPRDFKALLLVSKQVHSEVKPLFYKEATFTLSLGKPVRGRKASGDPVFAMRMGYRNQVTISEDNSRITFAKALHSWPDMFLHIRHLSLEVSLFMYSHVASDSEAAAQQNRMAEASRALLMICAFYAFTDGLNHLKTFTLCLVDGKRPKRANGDCQSWISQTLWPLMLLAGRAEIAIPGISREYFDRVDLGMEQVGPEMIEACLRFAKCFAFREKPSVNASSVELDVVRKGILKGKMKELVRFKTLIFAKDSMELLEFVKSMEGIEAEFLEHAEEDRTSRLTRTLAQIFGRRLVERSEEGAGSPRKD